MNKKRMKCEMSSSEEDSDAYYGLSEKNEAFQSTRKSGRKPKCFSKNAMLARENRLKKKIYITKLEGEVSHLKSENKKLMTVVDNQSFLIADLKKDIRYLKSVITNSTDIGCLVRNIRQSTDSSTLSSSNLNPFDDMSLELPFHEDLLGSEVNSLQEHDYTISEGTKDDVGVCLHVSKHRVSLEFCPSCSENSLQAWNN